MFNIIFTVTWIIKFTHWRASGISNYNLHLLLDDIYEKLSDYLDEYVESTNCITKISDLPSVVNKEYTPDELAQMLINLCNYTTRDKQEAIQDLYSRLSADINIWLFKLTGKHSLLE